MAFANAHPTHRSLTTIKQVQRNALISKGMVMSRHGSGLLALGVKFQGKSTVQGKAAKNLPPHSGFSNFGEPNALFVSWFGWFGGGTHVASGPYSGSFCYSYSGSNCVNHYKYKDFFSETIQQSAAQPFAGKGSATSVSIGAEQYSGSGGATVGIYTNTTNCAQSGISCPGNALGTGSFSTAVAFTGQCCSGLDTVSISPSVKLSKKKSYWVVVSRNGSANGRVAWNGQASNWTALGGEDYKYTLTEVIDDTYHTTRFGGHSTYKTTIHDSSNGWIHTAAYSYAEPSAGFSVN